MSEKVLFVDDDPNILRAFQRQFRKQFYIETASGGAEGLEAIRSSGPFAVVVSDMRMPVMDGIQFLSEVRQQAADSVRIMLTGNADQETAIEAVNEGQIFRFLTKPCPPEALAKILAAGVRQYQLVTAERQLLGKTLRGSVKVLTDVLSLINPTAFGRASRVQRLVQRLCKQLNVEQAWECEIAAMLSQIGCVTVPPDTLDKMYHGWPLTPEESTMFEGHPSVGRDLVANIPRLEPVAEIIAYQQKGLDGSGPPSDSPAGEELPVGARILKVALDYDALTSSGLGDVDAIVELCKWSDRYDPEVLAALEVLADFAESFEIRQVRINDLTTQMTLADDVKMVNGTLLVSKGQEVTMSMRQRLMNFARDGHVQEPVSVLVRAKNGPGAT